MTLGWAVENFVAGVICFVSFGVAGWAWTQVRRLEHRIVKLEARLEGPSSR